MSDDVIHKNTDSSRGSNSSAGLVDIHSLLTDPARVHFRAWTDFFADRPLDFRGRKVFIGIADVKLADFQQTVPVMVETILAGLKVNFVILDNLASIYGSMFEMFQTHTVDHLTITLRTIGEVGWDRRKKKNQMNVWTKKSSSVKLKELHSLLDPDHDGNTRLHQSIPLDRVEHLTSPLVLGTHELGQAMDMDYDQTPHPGKTLGNFFLGVYQLTPEKIVEDGVNRSVLMDLLAGERPFDESMREIFKRYIGDDADLLFRVQQVYDYESRTGKVHSGRWIKDGDEYKLAPD